MNQHQLRHSLCSWNLPNPCAKATAAKAAPATAAVPTTAEDSDESSTWEALAALKQAEAADSPPAKPADSPGAGARTDGSDEDDGASKEGESDHGPIERAPCHPQRAFEPDDAQVAAVAAD